MTTQVRNNRTPVTKKLFHYARKQQKAGFSQKTVMHNTGLSITSVNEIRRLKTWPAWEKTKADRNRTRRPRTTVGEQLPLETAPTTDDELQASIDSIAAAAPQYALATDLEKSHKALLKDINTINDTLYPGNDTPGLVNEAASLQEAFSGLREEMENLHWALGRVERQMQDLSAFRDKVNASPFLGRLLKRAAKRVARENDHGRN